MSLYTDKSNILMCQDQSEAFLERSKDSISKLEEQQTGMVYVTCKPGSQGRLLVQGRASATQWSQHTLWCQRRTRASLLYLVRGMPYNRPGL